MPLKARDLAMAKQSPLNGTTQLCGYCKVMGGAWVHHRAAGGVVESREHALFGKLIMPSTMKGHEQPRLSCSQRGASRSTSSLTWKRHVGSCPNTPDVRELRER